MNNKIIAQIVGSLILFAGLLNGCGNDPNAPEDGSLVISTADISWDIGAAGGCTGSYPPTRAQNHFFDITVYDSSGQPLGNVDLEITLVLTDNSNTGATRVWLFDDVDEDGFLDDTVGSDEFVTESTDPTPYLTTTDQFGNKRMWLVLEIGGSCSYTGHVNVFSGPLHDSLEFSVTGP